jgi:hypothetical protein
MTVFLRITAEDRFSSLRQSCAIVRDDEFDSNVYMVSPKAFKSIPGASFAYWASDDEFGAFSRNAALESSGFTAKQGLATADDFRFLRLWWEVPNNVDWQNFAKGGTYSLYYSDVHLVVNWKDNGKELSKFSGSVIRNPQFYFSPGLTWPLRTQSGLGMRLLPAGCIFGHKGPAIFSDSDCERDLLALLSVTTSSLYSNLIELHMAFGSYEVGAIQRNPLPELSDSDTDHLADLASAAWILKRKLDFDSEVSHAYIMPAVFIEKLLKESKEAIGEELVNIRSDIDAVVARLYGMKAPDGIGVISSAVGGFDDEAESEVKRSDHDLLSWCIGVVFGRLDCQLAIGEREVPSVPEPFSALPAKSLGMLPDGVEPFHICEGILVDDPGHSHDLSQLIESVLKRVDLPAPDEMRSWLRKDFFKEHLKQYSKSRRKAPIYWPLATATGSYTLWVYYPDLDDQTLYTAINDFLEPKLKLIGDSLNSLRAKPCRSPAEERELENQEDLEQELIDMRDTILEIAPAYKPNHDDGVQITAAPLWPLFRHRPWQKVLKDTWEKLEAGEYDWAHLAYSYWPERVHEKCKTDKSLAIAHGLHGAG